MVVENQRQNYEPLAISFKFLGSLPGFRSAGALLVRMPDATDYIAHTACILSAWYEQRIVSARSDLLRQRRSSVMLAVCLCVSASVSKTTRQDAAGYGRMFLDR